MSSTVNISLKASVFLLIFCLDDLFIVVSWVLKSPTNTCYGNFCFYYVCYYLAYMFTCSYARYMYIFINIISSFWVEPLNIMWCPSFPFVIVFVLKSILLIKIVLPLVSFHSVWMEHPFPSFHFQSMCVFSSELRLL